MVKCIKFHNPEQPSGTQIHFQAVQLGKQKFLHKKMRFSYVAMHFIQYRCQFWSLFFSPNVQIQKQLYKLSLCHLANSLYSPSVKVWLESVASKVRTKSELMYRVSTIVSDPCDFDDECFLGTLQSEMAWLNGFPWHRMTIKSTFCHILWLIYWALFASTISFMSRISNLSFSHVLYLNHRRGSFDCAHQQWKSKVNFENNLMYIC